MVPDRNLILDLKFEETSGSVAYDSSPSANNATFYNTGGISWQDTGRVDKCVYMAQYSPNFPYAVLGSEIALTGDFTISAWIYPGQTNQDHWIIAGYNGSKWSGMLLSRSTGYPTFYIDDTGYNPSTHHGFSANTWYNMVARRVGNKLDVWLNNSKIINNATCKTATLYLQNLCKLYSSYTYDRLYGRLDCVRVYNTGLMDLEIAALYNESTSTKNDVWAYPTISESTSDQGGYVNIVPDECYSPVAASDPYNPIAPDQCYSAAACDQITLEFTIVTAYETHSQPVGDEISLDVSWAYPFGVGQLLQKTQAIVAMGGGIAVLKQAKQEIDGDGFCYIGGTGLLLSGKQEIHAEGGGIGVLLQQKQLVEAEGYPLLVGSGSLTMKTQAIQGEGGPGIGGSGILRQLQQAIVAHGHNSFASGILKMKRQRIIAHGAFGVCGSGELLQEKQAISGTGGMVIVVECVLYMEKQEIRGTASSPSRFDGVVLSHAS